MPSELQRRVAEALRRPPVSISADTIAWKPFDASPGTVYVRFLGELALKVNVVSQVEKERVVTFLKEVSPADLESASPEHPLVLLPMEHPVAPQLPLRAIQHPSAREEYVSLETRFMAPQTYCTFPANRCEFTAHDDQGDVRYRLSKVIRQGIWDRQPSPAFTARWHFESGQRSTGGKRMGIMEPERLERFIAIMEKENGFIEVGNFEDKIARFEHANGRFRVLVDDAQLLEAPSIEAVLAWLRQFGVEGLAAGRP